MIGRAQAECAPLGAGRYLHHRQPHGRAWRAQGSPSRLARTV